MKKKYIEIDLKLDWKEILPRIQADQIFLLNQGEKDFILGWGMDDQWTASMGEFESDGMQNFIDRNAKNYIFSYLSYDIKNKETRSLKPLNGQSNDAHFLVPKHVLIFKNDVYFYFGSLDLEGATNYFKKIENQPIRNRNSDKVTLIPATSESEYIEKIKAIKAQIQAGIIYEMNYCVDFHGKFDNLNPFHTYLKLMEQSSAPFSCFVKHNHHSILSASPERFIVKSKNKLTSQPIKGTAKRGSNFEEDERIKKALSADPKEISENVMIVDLVRNDLSKIAAKKSVVVEELCKIYSFKTVHQLISTISCELKPNQNFAAIMASMFPMGSMTGAPKISAIQQINDFETFNRGIYSGSIGFIEPNGNFDFNVVIRTILVDELRKSVNCRVGGAITIHSVPENEYNECLLKLKALKLSLC